MEKSRAGTKNIIHSVIQSSQPVSGPSSFLIHSITKLQFLSRILQHFESLANFFCSLQNSESLPGSLLDIERGAKTLTRLLVIHCPIQMNINGDILIILTSSPGNGFGNGTR